MYCDSDKLEKEVERHQIKRRQLTCLFVILFANVLVCLCLYFDFRWWENHDWIAFGVGLVYFYFMLATGSGSFDGESGTLYREYFDKWEREIIKSASGWGTNYRVVIVRIKLILFYLFMVCAGLMPLVVVGSRFWSSSEDEVTVPENALENHLGKYCYIDDMNIVHADRHCKKLGYKDMMPPTRVRTERYDLEGSIEGYCPVCVSDDDYELLVELKKRPPSRRPPLFDD